MNKCSSFSIFQGLFYVIFCGVMTFPVALKSQVFFQLEQANTTKVHKYSAGDRIIFKTKAYPDVWHKANIYRILPEDNALVFDDRIVHLPDITHFKFYRTWPNAIGTNLMRFGVAWFAFAGIIEGGRAIGVLDTQYEFGTDTAIIGGVAILTGFLTKKLWGVSVRKMNNRNRVRIIDLRL